MKGANKSRETIKINERHIAELQELNQDLLNRITAKMDEKEKQEERQQRALLIADSNGREIHTFLRGWDMTTNTYTIKNLEMIKTDEIKDHKNIAVLLGTNNIKNGTNEKDKSRYHSH